MKYIYIVSVFWILTSCSNAPTYVAYADSMEYTPFDQKLYPGSENILSRLSKPGHRFEYTTDINKAHFLVGGGVGTLEPHVKRYGAQKKYMIWTHEPRQDLNRQTKIQIQNVDVELLNVYNERIYFNNYYFLDYPKEFDHFRGPLLTEMTPSHYGARLNKAVILASYASKDDSNYYYRSMVPEDLAILRSQIALDGQANGMVDVHGKGWPTGVVVENTRGSAQWKTGKHNVMEKYRFAIVFENTNIKHYVTEKIWDAIYAGALPVYYGNDWIYETFGKDSFVDYRDFASPRALTEFLKAMTADEWTRRINSCIRAYNASVNLVSKENIHSRRDEAISSVFADWISGK